jgi:hypothetical protein
MLRSLKAGARRPGRSRLWIMLVCLALPAGAAILPDYLGRAAKEDSTEVRPADPELFEEYGFEAGERARYGPVEVAAWRFKDSTGAMSAFQFMRPADAKPSRLDRLAAYDANGLILQHGNYVIEFKGRQPTEVELVRIIQGLPQYSDAALPVISTYLPADGLIPNSERYITGPVSLERFDPGVPPSTAAFHLSAEAQFGRYHSRQGDFGLAIFNYPTPALARQQAIAFQKLSGAMVKRVGPLVAVILNPPDADAAERVIAKVTYEASVTQNETVPGTEVRSFARAFLSMVMLAGIIIAFCVISGLLFAGARILSRRFGTKDASEDMITLHLEGK